MGTEEVAPAPTSAPAVLEPVAATDDALAPVAVAEQQPVAQPATAGRRSRRGLWLAIGLIVVLILGAGGGGFFLNQTLSQRYSAQQAVLDYFAAQAKGDVKGMLANSMFDQPAGAYSGLFNSDALAQMMQLPENTQISGVRIQSMQTIDDSSDLATVAMTWAGTSRVGTYLVRRDNSSSHYLLYHSWHLVIPNGTIALKLPNQPGQVVVDQIVFPASEQVYVIAGYHHVTMLASPFWDVEGATVKAIDGATTLTIQGHISASATAAAAASVKAAIPHCDTTKYTGCQGHTYTAPDQGDVWYFVMPGYGEIDYNTYVFNLTGDMTQGMVLVVTSDANKVTASGTCAETMTVDGSRNYTFKGTWTATLTWSGAQFVADVTTECHTSRA